MFRFKITLVALCLLIFLISCDNHTLNTFPDCDIVYQTPETEDFQVGFVNSDGTNNQIFVIPRNERWQVTPFFEAKTITLPIITSDSKTLIFRNQPASGQSAELIIYTTGSKAIKCSGEKTEFYGSLRPFLLDGDDALLLWYYPNKFHLSIFKIDNCGTEIPPISVLSSSYADSEILSGGITKDKTKLVYSKVVEGKIAQVIIYDFENDAEEFLAIGIEPVWSPDEQYLAYIGTEGIYIADEELDIKLIVPYQNPEHGGIAATEGDWPPIVSWSPDSQWLTYHKCTLPVSVGTWCREEDYSIFKVNITTGEEFLIVEGGLNPYWRK